MPNSDIKISIIMSTYRTGGLDITLAGMAHQTFPTKDFELIVIDPYFEWRRDAVRKYIKKKKHDIPLLHINPSRTTMPLDCGSMHRNSGLLYAEGELVIFMCDYGYVRPDWLDRHWNIYINHDKKVTGMGPHRYWVHPEIKPTWKTEPISVFQEEFTPAMLDSLEMTGPGTQDPKLQLPSGGIGGSFFHLKNEAVKLDTLLSLNGCDEGYDKDGGHCYSDMDMGFRAEKIGNPFTLDPTNILEIVQIRDFYPFCTRNRTTEDDYNYYLSRVSEWEKGNTKAPNPFDIMELREKALRSKPRLK